MSGSNRSIKVYDLGLTDYRDVHVLQQRLQAQRRESAGVNSLLLTEHRPVITLGRSHPEPALRAPREFIEANGIPIVQTERGGDITYHGPGQLVAYGIVDLKEWDLPVLEYVSGLEDVACRVLGDWGIAGERVPAARGVWVAGSKVASIGLNVRRWVTMHGIALNVDPDMTLCAMINPCGMADVEMTSMARHTSQALPMDEVRGSFIGHFKEVMDCAVESIELPGRRAAAG
jgi:lipoate-protein ligase B